MVKEDDLIEERAGLLEIIDDLILHINVQKTWFTLLLIATLFLAPLTLLIALSITLHPIIFKHIFRIGPLLGMLFILLLILTSFTSIFWIIFGVKEYSFIGRWDKRFRKYFSLKEQLDRELRKEFGE